MSSAMGTRYVYFAHDGKPSKRVKIGLSRDVPGRMKALNCQLLFAVPCSYSFARQLEQTLHAEFAPNRVELHREGGTEWFLTDARLDALIRYVRTTRTWPWDYSEVMLP